MPGGKNHAGRPGRPRTPTANILSLFGKRDMDRSVSPTGHPTDRFLRWLLEGQTKEMEGPHERPGKHHKHTWWQVIDVKPPQTTPLERQWTRRVSPRF